MNIFFLMGEGIFLKKWKVGLMDIFFSSRGGTVFFKKMDMNGFFFFFSREGGLFFFFFFKKMEMNVLDQWIFARSLARSLALSLPPFNGNE